MKNIQSQDIETTEFEEPDKSCLFQIADGRYVIDKAQSAKLFKIAEAGQDQNHPMSATGYSWDERGLSELFAECYSEDTRYCPEIGKWFTYSNGAWRHDPDDMRATAKMEEFTQLLCIYGAQISNEDRRSKYMKFLGKLGDLRFRDRILRNAKSKMTISASDFDANPYQINCLNGTYDLKTGIFREHSPTDLITQQTAFEYTLKPVKYPRWEKFIEEVTQGDNDKARYLQKALGYSIIGNAHEECMFILHGKTTRNGKSTMLNAVHHLLGDYASVASVSLICKNGAGKNPNAPTPALASLKGKRFVTMAESDQYGKLDEEMIKQLTGGEEVSARPMYARETITFLPQFTLWLSCNDLPAVQDKSLFASDRVRVIEFNKHFSEQEQERTLKDEFRTPAAMQGIFLWLTEGYRLYKSEGLNMPAPMRGVVKQYEKDNDLVLMFLEEKCEHFDTTIRKKALYEAFKIWLRSNGYQFTPSAQKFNKAVEGQVEWYMGDGEKSAGYPTYAGLRLRE